jgi:hypothetical protein
MAAAVVGLMMSLPDDGRGFTRGRCRHRRAMPAAAYSIF